MPRNVAFLVLLQLHKEEKVKKIREGNPLLYLFSQVWRWSENNRKKVVLFWFMFLCAELVDIALLPLVWSKVLNIIQVSGRVTSENIWSLVGLLFLSLLGTNVFWFFHGKARVMETVNAFDNRLNYRKYLLNGILSLPLSWHNEHHSGDTIDKIEKGTSSIFNFAEGSFQIIYALVSFFITVGLLSYFAGWATLGMFPPMLLSIWITIRYDTVIVENYKKLSRNENEVSESVFDAISNITTVVILRVEKVVFDSIIKKANRLRELFVKNTKMVEMKWYLTSNCAKLVSMSVLFIYFYGMMNNPSTVMLGGVYLVIRYVQNVGDLFFRFTSVYGDVIKQRARVHNAEILSADFVEQEIGTHLLPENWKKIQIEGLNFTYGSNGDRSHLDNVWLTIWRGEKIAFVGETGSGKTTLLKVMRGLHSPERMRLLVDGTFIATGFDGICDAIALVPQDPEIFTSTIMENITMKVDYDEAEVLKATDMAHFTSVGNSLPQKFESKVNEKGVNLSGGQRQRLALARGILAGMHKDILLLDEPTSSLDLATEQAVYQNILSMAEGKTVVSTIHRLHLLPYFDTVYMFKDGKIVCSGHVEELLRSCPEFQELWNKQTV
jgi:ATP-binding cassette subfamily B protein